MIHIRDALNKLVGLELTKAKRELGEIEVRISYFETKYNMQSENFDRKFHAASVDDSADFMEWISFMDMRSILKEQTNRLIGTEWKRKREQRKKGYPHKRLA
ncbi:MAG: hypothetical protein JRI73_10800 [Deltaproteobacteria bacterium]|nr:hypothetical protein [Deltaproteobacteria bacterium]